MADVLDAFDEVLGRPVAVKVLRGIDDPDAARRFAEEIRLTARVNHPNIVALYDAGEHDGSPYLVLERVTGGTLAAEMNAGPMDPRRIAAIGEQIASALSHSHAAGIVHRDVKPTNILLAADGSVRLADFGIAVTATATRLTVAGTVAGSAGYVSPEQVLGSGVGAPSDVYALGLVLLECLVGGPPWSGTTVEVALARLTSDPSIPDDLPDGWTTLLRAMTAREPDARPSIDLVGYALSRLAAEREYEAQLFVPAAPLQDARIPAVAGGSLVVLLLAAFLVLTTNGTPQPVADAAPQPQRAAVVTDIPLSKGIDRPVPRAQAEAPAPAPAPVKRGRADRPDSMDRKAKQARQTARTPRSEPRSRAANVAAREPERRRAAVTPSRTTTSRVTSKATSPRRRESDRTAVAPTTSTSVTTTTSTPRTTADPVDTISKKLKGRANAVTKRSAAADSRDFKAASRKRR